MLDLITELRIHRPELTASSDALAFADALHHADLARKLLDAHAALAKPGAYARMLGVRDLIMADNFEHFLALERGRGKALVFSAAGHLKRGMMQWYLPGSGGESCPSVLHRKMLRGNSGLQTGEGFGSGSMAGVSCSWPIPRSTAPQRWTRCEPASPLGWVRYREHPSLGVPRIRNRTVAHADLWTEHVLFTSDGPLSAIIDFDGLDIGEGHGDLSALFSDFANLEPELCAHVVRGYRTECEASDEARGPCDHNPPPSAHVDGAHPALAGAA